VFAHCDMMVLLFSAPLETIAARCWEVCPAGPF
jgi:hypothetical protein